METRLSLGRHAVKGDALVIDARGGKRGEAAEDAARMAAVEAMAAFGAFGVIAVAALQRDIGGVADREYGAPLFAAFPCADQGGR